MKSSGATYRFGSVEFCPSNLELRVEGEVRVLEPKSCRLLAFLVDHPNRVVSRGEIFREVWADTSVTDNALSRSVGQIRKALKDDPKESRFIETISTVGYRFVGILLPDDPGTSDIAPVSTFANGSLPTPPIFCDSAEPNADADLATLPSTFNRGSRRRNLAVVVGTGLVLVVAGLASFLATRQPTAQKEKNSVLVADFTNTTGDPVFDLTLHQGLIVQLEQSPVLRILTDENLQPTLRLMGRAPDQKLTPVIAREVCQRIASAAVLDGSIAEVGTHYLLTLKAVACSSGDLLASAEAEASDKNHVLDALGRTASQMRTDLGESLSTVHRFDTSLEQATTGSLEALQAYSLGRKVSAESDWADAVPFYRKAIDLDPKFAMAYARLGMNYRNLGETMLGMQNSSKAYELRDKVSESEKFYIESHYNLLVLGNLEKTTQVCETWKQSYPLDWVARANLADVYQRRGDYDKALSEALETIRLVPTAVGYHLLLYQYIALNRLPEARRAFQETQARKLDSPTLRHHHYLLEFLQNDLPGMAQEVEWARSKPGAENVLLDLEAQTAAYSGRLVRARNLSRAAVASARRVGETEVAAEYLGNAALREALYGNRAEARARATEALELSNGPVVHFLAALALASVGDADRAQRLAGDLGSRFPEHTLVQSYYVPTIRAAVALQRKDPSGAIEALESAKLFELGFPGALYPIYVRGESFLAARQGENAAKEFQQILDHPGIVANAPIGALAHLGLGRAYALSGDTVKARVACQSFLTLWREGDPNLPLLKRAEVECASVK